MKGILRNIRHGYTVVELLATIVIVAVLATTVGAFFAQLLSLQEREREEAFVREKLADVCGSYADLVSVGSFFSMQNSLSNHVTSVAYRLETGGVSLETGLVSRVAQLSTLMSATNRTMDVDVYSIELGELKRKLSRKATGDAPLIPLVGDMVSCTITPLNANISEDEGIQTSDAVLGYLQVSARYEVENDDGIREEKTVTAGRIVRLWNRE